MFVFQDQSGMNFSKFQKLLFHSKKIGKSSFVYIKKPGGFKLQWQTTQLEKALTQNLFFWSIYIILQFLGLVLFKTNKCFQRAMM